VNPSADRSSKIGHDFKKYIKWFKKIFLIKNVLLNEYSSMKENQKDSNDF
jgi:hypothetical protein